MVAANQVENIAQVAWRVIEAIESVIVGKREVVEKTLIALLSRGHLLLHDVPGVGKTTLGKAFAKVLDCSFKRIQCTPDLLPSDITGSTVYDLKTGNFTFNEGPIFAHIVLVDEINRASPKTQSSLLECMDEYQVTMDGIPRPLPSPFMVIATQNPLEQEGIFSLPESQTDRFGMRLKMGYPSLEEERQIVLDQLYAHPLDSLSSIISREEVLNLQRAVRDVYVHPLVQDYLLTIVHRTRQDERIQVGASPRASIFLFRASQAMAALKGRAYVLPDDVKALAINVIAHRILLHPQAILDAIPAEQLVQEILNVVPVPDAELVKG